MAVQPRKPCPYPGCRALVAANEPRCATHGALVRAQHDAQRGSAAKRGYGSKWQRARADHLREYPLCAEHERQGQLAAATEVDHVIPHRGDLTLFWRRSNWQSLCKSCHSSKTATEDGGFGR